MLPASTLSQRYQRGQTYKSDGSGLLPVSRDHHQAAALEPSAATVGTAPIDSPRSVLAVPAPASGKTVFSESHSGQRSILRGMIVFSTDPSDLRLSGFVLAATKPNLINPRPRRWMMICINDRPDPKSDPRGAP